MKIILEVDTDADDVDDIGEALRQKLWDRRLGFGCYENFDWADGVRGDDMDDTTTNCPACGAHFVVAVSIPPGGYAVADPSVTDKAAEVLNLRARLEEVERERDALMATNHENHEIYKGIYDEKDARAQALAARADSAEAALAAAQSNLDCTCPDPGCPLDLMASHEARHMNPYAKKLQALAADVQRLQMKLGEQYEQKQALAAALVTLRTEAEYLETFSEYGSTNARAIARKIRAALAAAQGVR